MTWAATLLQRAGRTLDAADADAVEARLRTLWNDCETAWPSIELDPATFLTYIGERLSPDGSALEALTAIRARELYLCCGCAAGQRAAIEALQTHYGAHLDAVLSRAARPGLQSRDDLEQVVRDHLFVGDTEQPPRITRYSGHGSFEAWLRVTARRTASNANRRKDPVGAADDALELPDHVDDPELNYLKGRYREEFREAFFEAVTTLEPRQRTLLRQAFVHGLNVRQIARMYQIHHATAARWIASAREQLASGTREALARQLELSERELRSIMVLIRSRLDLSIARALDSSGSIEPPR